MATSAARGRRGRRLLLFLGSLAFGLLLLEGFARLALRPLAGTTLDAAGLDARRAARLAALQADTGPDAGQKVQLHPYLGFVSVQGRGTGDHHVGPHGLQVHRDHPQPVVRGPDTWVIAITGGSFAEDLATVGARSLLAAVERELDLGGRRPVVVCLAHHGWKQPQQLMAWAWMDLMGVRADVLINLDGFNELALGQSNAVAGVHPAFPSAEHMGALARQQTGHFDRKTLTILGDLSGSLNREEWVLDTLAGTGLGHTAIGRVIGERWMQRAAHRQQRFHFRLARAFAGGIPAAFRGPPLSAEADPLDRCVSIWAEASRQLATLCRARGVRYLHVLQPNQYIPGSKPMGAEEQRIAIHPDSAWGARFRAAHPRARAAGKALRADGIEFHDLTDVFGAVTEPVYRDDCCHVNARGNAIVADRLARWLAAGQP